MNRDCFWLTEDQFSRLAPLLPTDTRGKPRVSEWHCSRPIVEPAQGKTAPAWRGASAEPRVSRPKLSVYRGGASHLPVAVAHSGSCRGSVRAYPGIHVADDRRASDQRVNGGQSAPRSRPHQIPTWTHPRSRYYETEGRFLRMLWNGEWSL